MSLQQGHSNLYVQARPSLPTADEEVLANLFRPFGVVLSTRILRSKNRESSSEKSVFAFVKMSTVSEAQAAIEGLDGSSLMGCILEVRTADHDVFDAVASSSKMPPPSDNIYCKNLPFGFGELELHYLFSPYGEITSCRILCQGDATGEGGAAMVRLASTQQAVQAVQALRGHRIRGSLHPLIVRFADSADIKAKKLAKQGSSSTSEAGLPQAVSAAQALQPNFNPYARLAEAPAVAYNPTVAASSTQCVSSLYVANLPPDASKLFLYEIFSPFGAILSIKVLSDEKGVSRGVAFVNFCEPACAATAVAALHNLAIGDRKLHVAFQTRKLPGDLQYFTPFLHL